MAIKDCKKCGTPVKASSVDCFLKEIGDKDWTAIYRIECSECERHTAWYLNSADPITEWNE